MGKIKKEERKNKRIILISEKEFQKCK